MGQEARPVALPVGPTEELRKMNEALRIGIIGDYDPGRRSHQATMDALNHAADRLSISPDIRWLPTESLLAPGTEEKLRAFAGLWAAPGSPYRSEEGAHKGIRFAREEDWPFIGT